MEVIIEFAGRIKAFDKIFKNKKSKRVDLPENADVLALLAKEKIPENFVVMVSINNNFCKKDSILKDKDKVKLYPPICGG